MPPPCQPVGHRGSGITRVTEAMPRAWQRMLSGRRLDLLDPSPADIEIEDIAHGLARVARWNGQTAGASPFSVAQHSVLVEDILIRLDPARPSPDRLAALLHDGPEYVIGDLISPFKVVLGEAYKAIEQRLLKAIHRRFGLPPSPPPLTALIKQADQIAAFLEATQLAGFGIDEASRFFGRPSPALAADVGPLVPQRSPDAEAVFLARFTALWPGDAA